MQRNYIVISAESVEQLSLLVNNKLNDTLAIWRVTGGVCAVITNASNSGVAFLQAMYQGDSYDRT